VVPVNYAKLSFTKSGIVSDILVEEGSKVKKGDVIARLQESESLQAQVAQAEEAVLLAEQAIKDLKENAKLDEANAFNRISTAYDALREAGRQLYYFNLPINQRNLEMFEAADLMRERLEQARKAYEPYKYESEQYGAATERTKLKKALDDAESDFRTALLRISYASSEKSAMAELQKALSDYDKLKNGPDPDKMAAAEAKLKSAQATLASAKAALDDLQVTAPFDGTVAKIDIKVGEM
jgi:HlyD family secretion protein